MSSKESESNGGAIDDFIPISKYMAENNLSENDLKIQILNENIYPYFLLDMPKAIYQYLLTTIEDDSRYIDIFSEPVIIHNLIGFFAFPVDELLKLFRADKKPVSYEKIGPVKVVYTSKMLRRFGEDEPEEILEGNVQFSITDIFIFLGYYVFGYNYLMSRAETFEEECAIASLEIPDLSYASLDNPIEGIDGTIFGYNPPRHGKIEPCANPQGFVYMRPIPEVETFTPDGKKTKQNNISSIPPITLDDLYLSKERKPILTLNDLLKESEKKESANSFSSPPDDSLTDHVEEKEESEYAVVLELAKEKFWDNYDPKDRTTAPTKQQVTKFLMEKGYPKTLAASADTILRGGRYRPN